jgi:hypothetical protein
MWIPEEVGCRLQDDPPCKSDTALGTRTSETSQRRYCTKNSEETNVQEEILEGPGIQNWNKGLRWQTAAMFAEGEENHERHWRVEIRTAITSAKQRNAHEDPV